ncbi:unnamed protein product, partial [Brassica rapa subsp. narinosa]
LTLRIACAHGGVVQHVTGSLIRGEGLRHIVSFMASCTIEEVASSCNAVRFVQIYVYKQRQVTAQMVKRAEKAGFKDIVLTVDVPKLGSGIEAVASRALDASFSWKGVKVQC